MVEGENKPPVIGNTAELFLISSQSFGPFIEIPNEQSIAEILGKVPWSGFTGNNEISFNWGLIDRPEAGSTFLVFLAPANKAPPPDGLRYLPSEPQETSIISRHDIVCATVDNPTQASNITVELECLSMNYGHFPPTSSTSPLPADSPELKLTRYRRRYRIVRGGGNPGLNLIWWGKNENGGGTSAVDAPPGFEKDPIRAYPLPGIFSTIPVHIFGGNVARSIPPQVIENQSNSRPTSSSGIAYPPSMPAGFSTPYNQATKRMPISGGNAAYNQQQQQHAQQLALAQVQASIYSQGAAQQQALASGVDPRLLLSQQQQQQQQQQHNQSQLHSNMIQQQQQQQQLLQQQSQQQQQILQQQQLAKQAQARRSKGQFQQDPRMTAHHQQQLQQQQLQQQQLQQQQHHQQQQQHQLQQQQQQNYEDNQPGDILDVLTTRQMAITRFSKNHDVMEMVFDPWSVNSILKGEKRVRDEEEILPKNKNLKQGWENWLELSSGGENLEGKYGPEVGERLNIEERKERLQKRLEKVIKENEAEELKFEEKKKEVIALGVGL